MIFRLLLLFLIIWFLFWILKKQFLGNNSDNSKAKPEEVEDMLACSYCGTHVPKSLGFQSVDKFYCCQEHAKLDNPDTKDSQ
ncbi:MAG: hypothetical protein HOC92_15500 [Gammaproteobacteria bacterium]|jgi:uncharacterized protein|nr:hypothetical protein [Gammaproteobacteria bacterium]MBT4193659.1 hypothetical protein [Gammaproteobacteria bacterium]MBT4451102.1 hypothetical protein [Gammaproteobacteria bacterium]